MRECVSVRACVRAGASSPPLTATLSIRESKPTVLDHQLIERVIDRGRPPLSSIPATEWPGPVACKPKGRDTGSNREFLSKLAPLQIVHAAGGRPRRPRGATNAPGNNAKAIAPGSHGVNARARAHTQVTPPVLISPLLYRTSLVCMFITVGPMKNESCERGGREGKRRTCAKGHN